MSKKDLLQEAVSKGLIPKNSVEKDYTLNKLKVFLEVTDDVIKESISLFETAIKEKAIPEDSVSSNYTDSYLEAIIDVNRKEISKYKKDFKDHKESNKKDNK